MSGRKVCVFCASSTRVAHKYLEAAREMGRGLARGGHRIVYGGGSQGLMGELARAAIDEGAFVTGIYPEALFKRFGREIILENLDEAVVVDTMHQRKAEMAERSDLFLALPGGFGTFEEIVEVISHRQINIHEKPCLLLNLDGYYDHLLAQFERSFEEMFTPEEYRDAYAVADSATEALDMIEKRLL